MENLFTIKIETKRLLLLPIKEEYAQSIFESLDDEITRYMFPKSPKEIKESQYRVLLCQLKIERGSDLPLVILNKETKEFIGVAGIHYMDKQTPELGIRIKKTAHGNKLGREAVMGIERWAQDNIHFDYLLYPVDKDNIPSRKIAETLGGILELDQNGEPLVVITETEDSNKKLNLVFYRIKKI